MFKNINNQQIQEISAYIFMIIFMFAILHFHVIPAVLAGLLAYVMTTKLMHQLSVKIPSDSTQSKIVGMFVGLGSLGLISFLVFILIKALNGENMTDMTNTVIETINQSRKLLPPEIAVYIPDNISEMKKNLISNLKEHLLSFANFGKGALYSILLVLIGWLIGILIACQKKSTNQTHFSKKWNELWRKLSESFRFVVFAQVKVAAFNSIFMAIFLFIVCPIIGWDIPYSKMLVVITFLCGLLPIIGNLISNSISFILALTVSFPAAIAALCMLMLVHKLEYFIISKSLGSDIDSDIWELLIVLFAFEILFGVAGMVFSPILYAFFKTEMRQFNWLPTTK